MTDKPAAKSPQQAGGPPVGFYDNF
jgi:hypothetical protein